MHWRLPSPAAGPAVHNRQRAGAPAANVAAPAADHERRPDGDSIVTRPSGIDRYRTALAAVPNPAPSLERGAPDVDAVSLALRDGRALSDGFPPVELSHVFAGEISSKHGVRGATGFHHSPADALHPNARVVETLSPPNARGVYEARVEVRDPASGATYMKRSTMFPDSLGRAEAVAALQHAYAQATWRQGNAFTGPSGRGFDVTGFTAGSGSDLHIRTGYPVYAP